MYDKLREDPDFKDALLSMTRFNEIVEDWLRANKRNLSDKNKQETRLTLVQIAKWNANLPDNDSRKVDLSDAHFWSGLRNLIKTYGDIWLDEAEGASYISALLKHVIPPKVTDKITIFCTNRRDWLDLARNQDIVLDMSQEVFVALFNEDCRALKELDHPGTLWRYLRTIVERLFSFNVHKLCFTESFDRSRLEKDPVFAHLSIYTWSPTIMENALLKDNLYAERIRLPFRSAVEKYYKPDEEDSPGGDIAEYNRAIKQDVALVLNAITEEREFPVSSISLSYNSISMEPYNKSTSPTAALKRVLTLPDQEYPDSSSSDDSFADGCSGYVISSPSAPVLTAQKQLTSIEAMGIVKEIFGNTNPILIEVFFILCFLEKRDSDFTNEYALELEQRGVFTSSAPRFSYTWKTPVYKMKKRAKDQFEQGALKALEQKRIVAEDINLVLEFFRSHNYKDVVNELNNK